VESEGGLDYFVMKYVTGHSLEQLLDEGPIPIDVARRVLREAALALGHAHRRKVVHRDVKPANIMLEEDGRVVLTDFGISKAAQGASQLTGTGTIIGTPHYMAPEQAKGLEVDGRADQYSLAVVGHQVLTGKQPFDGSAHSILYKHVFEPPPPVGDLRPDVPQDLSAAIARALAKEPDERFATMEDFAKAVGGDRRGPATLVSAPVKPMVRPAPAKPRSRTFIERGAIALGLCLLIGGAAWASLREAPLWSRKPATRDVPLVMTSTPIPAEPVTAQPTAAEPAKKPVRRDPIPLTVESEPWAVLYLDDVELGVTPITDIQVLPGKHRIRLEQEGYLTKLETITISGSSPIKRNYNLEPAGPP
jgi:serine/threonine-protein kinase